MWTPLLVSFVCFQRIINLISLYQPLSLSRNRAQHIFFRFAV